MGGTDDTGDYGQSVPGGYGSNKPGIGDKVRGTAEVVAGKATGNEGLVEKGQDRKVRLVLVSSNA
jgi:hypothetical protein